MNTNQQRRNPLSTAQHHNAPQQHQQTPYKAQQPQLQPPPPPPKSPPLPRQNAKAIPPSPPKIIEDQNGAAHLRYQRVGFLGEGGFARVYEVRDVRGTRLACKVVTKDSLKTKKAKTKLYAEIKIHRSLAHPNIVTFHDCFEDSSNVYMTLALCTNGSVMDLLRRRRRFTEPEARVFMVQLIGACHYMHTHQVIHRDLKLGNLFLDTDMNIKVGDFGLAALIEQEGERKKTICGTPNYIAPEVLFDTANGHSFEVDTWSIGVILYTLVVGKPPFQTKDVKSIYKRIRDNEYEFPSGSYPSQPARDLVQRILTPNPTERPSLHEIVDDNWFVRGIVPPHIPVTVHDRIPDWRHLTARECRTNLLRIRRAAWLDGEPEQPTSHQHPIVSLPRAPGAQVPQAPASSAGSVASSRVAPSAVTSIAQQEKEFQRAVQPGSPISALLSSARQPLVMAAASQGPGGTASQGRGESPLMRKLQQAARPVRESPLRMSIRRDEDPAAGEKERKELESQKARIVAQMVPAQEEDVDMGVEDPEEREKPVPFTRLPSVREEPGVDIKDRDGKAKLTVGQVRARMAEKRGERENLPPVAVSAPVATTKVVRRERSMAPPSGPLASSTSLAPQPSASAPAPKAAPTSGGFDSPALTLSVALLALSQGRTFRPSPTSLPHLAGSKVLNDLLTTGTLPEERIFIVSWVDYCNKYGMGYALTDGSVGVHFNDSTSCVLSPNKIHFDYITSQAINATGAQPVYHRKNHTVATYPPDMKSKVYLMKHFEKYILDRLYGEADYTYEDMAKTQKMEWVIRYLRMKSVIVFLMSHGVLQFNFYDHTKVILSSHGLAIAHLDKTNKLTRWTLSEVITRAIRGAPPASAFVYEGGVDQRGMTMEEEAKFHSRLMDKLKYCKEVLVSIRSATGGGAGVLGESAEEGEERRGEGVKEKASRAGLR